MPKVVVPLQRGTKIRYLAVVDGEHYPPVVERALADLVAEGHEVLAAVLVGGREKLPAEGVDAYGEVRVLVGEHAGPTLDKALVELSPDAVLDLSDEPVLDYRKRFELASVALYRGVAYRGADFELSPPPRPRIATKPSLAIVGTGKRTGKTAVAGFVARALVETGIKPVIVAMGRGGPPEPEVLRGDELELRPQDLLELAAAGKHAASDYVEDALLGRVVTVGCRRCGGGVSGGVEISNVPQGVEIANGLPGDMLVLEGSGSAIPPVHADATVLIVPASIPEEYLAGYLGPYRSLLADTVIVTMCEEPFGSPSKTSSLMSHIRRNRRLRGQEDDPGREIRVIRTVFRPTPTRSVEGAEVFVTTTAPEAVAGPMKRHLEEVHGCKVVGISHSLSDRAKLREDLEGLGGKADVLLCEIKAAAIDVATRQALDEGLDVIYMDNVPHGIEGDDAHGALLEAAELARKRFSGSTR
jgi:cyclic 2,3-diphosphoglycerate synthetase